MTDPSPSRRGYPGEVLNARMLAHDLRNPLHVIGMALDAALLDFFSRSQLQQMFAVARQEANRMDQMLESLLVLAEIEAGELELCVRPVDVEILVGNACFSAERSNPGISSGIHQAINPAGLVAWVDEQRISDALSTILRLALKELPAAAKLMLRVERVGTEIWFIVQDSAFRIITGDQSLPLDRFLPAEGENSSAGRIEVITAKRIIELHAGRIGALRCSETYGAVVLAVPASPRTTS